MATEFIRKTSAKLLKHLNGTEPSAGEVDNLSEDIAKLLTTKYNVPEGKL